MNEDILTKPATRDENKHTSKWRLGDNYHVTGNAGEFRFLSATMESATEK